MNTIKTIKGAVGRPAAILLLCVTLLLASSMGGAAERAPAAEAPSKPTDRLRTAYSLSVYPLDSVMRNPNSSVATYFDIHPDTQIRGDAILNLWYSYSPILIPDLSTITVSVNGTPVDSRILRPEYSSRANWQVTIPEARFRPGVNEVEVSVVHRTIDGLCRDIDNDANWFVIRPETRLSFVLDKSPSRLHHFPRPFTDYYTPGEMNTVVYLPDDYDSALLAEAMNLGNHLAKNSQGGVVPRRLLLRTGQPGQYEANEIVFRHAERPMAEAEVTLSLTNLANGYSRLTITAADAAGFAKAIAALSRQQLVRTFQSDPLTLSSPLPPVLSADRVSFARNRRGVFRLSDFGLPNEIQVSGAFHQEALLFMRTPPNYRIADGSFIELHFRHSPILDPKKSAVTIYINDIPIRATALVKENANGGVLRATIPVSELSRSSWNVRFGFYHDLGIIDCSKRYDDVAWSTIEQNTRIVLKQGPSDYIPTWEDFPGDFFIDDHGRVSLTLLLADGLEQPDLTTLFKLAYYIGMQNASEISWRVADIDDFDVERAEGTIIAYGRQDPQGGWQKLAKYLPIRSEEGRFAVDERFLIVPETLKDFDIYQIGVPNAKSRIYAFMPATSQRMLELMDYSLRTMHPLGGQISLVDAKGETTPFYTSAPESSRPAAWYDFLVDRVGGTTIIYVGVLLAVLLVTVILLFLSRRG